MATPGALSVFLAGSIQDKLESCNVRAWVKRPPSARALRRRSHLTEEKAPARLAVTPRANSTQDQPPARLSGAKFAASQTRKAPRSGAKSAKAAARAQSVPGGKRTSGRGSVQERLTKLLYMSLDEQAPAPFAPPASVLKDEAAAATALVDKKDAALDRCAKAQEKGHLQTVDYSIYDLSSDDEDEGPKCAEDRCPFLYGAAVLALKNRDRIRSQLNRPLPGAAAAPAAAAAAAPVAIREPAPNARSKSGHQDHRRYRTS